jgi:hypothetical protein
MIRSVWDVRRAGVAQIFCYPTCRGRYVPVGPAVPGYPAGIDRLQESNHESHV